jgi:hypothetical protein
MAMFHGFLEARRFRIVNMRVPSIFQLSRYATKASRIHGDMPRVIITLLLLCQSFYRTEAEIGFTEPGVLSDGQGKSKVVKVHSASNQGL